jgi:hypothetical protein
LTIYTTLIDNGKYTAVRYLPVGNSLIRAAFLSIISLIVLLKARSNQPFKDTFRVIGDCKRYGGVLAFTILRLVNQITDVVGDAKAKITVHKNCNLMLLPMSSYEILIGLVIHSSVKPEDRQIAKNIEASLLATS